MDDIRAEDDLIPPDERRPQRLLDFRRQDDGELSDSDDEGEGGRRDHAEHRDKADEKGTTHAQPAGRPPMGIMRAASTGGAGPSAHGAEVLLTTVPAEAEQKGHQQEKETEKEQEKDKEQEKEKETEIEKESKKGEDVPMEVDVIAPATVPLTVPPSS